MKPTAAHRRLQAELEPVLQLFTQRYVRTPFSARFVHEATKNPGQLHARICHDIERVFAEQWRAKPQSLPALGKLYVLCNTGFTLQTWSGDWTELALADGGLLIAEGGNWFWARSEPMKQRPGIDYHGSIPG